MNQAAGPDGPAAPIQPCRNRSAATRLGPASLLTQVIDALRCLRLREVLVGLLAGLIGERLHVRALRAGHRLVAGGPLVRVLDGVGVALGASVPAGRHGSFLL